MNNSLSARSTDDLLMVADYRSSIDRSSAYDATELLLERWRRGTDLEFLVRLLESEKSYDRLRGAYFLGELGEAVERLKGPAIKLADDSLPDCRRAFVGYIAASDYYDQAIGKNLAKCLQDFNLAVRASVIEWAVSTSDEILETFSQLVEANAGDVVPTFRNPLSDEFWSASGRKRACRGLDIIRRLRSKEDIEHIRNAVPEEDSFVFDRLLFARTHRERTSGWRRKPKR